MRSCLRGEVHNRYQHRLEEDPERTEVSSQATSPGFDGSF